MTHHTNNAPYYVNTKNSNDRETTRYVPPDITALSKHMYDDNTVKLQEKHSLYKSYSHI